MPDHAAHLIRSACNLHPELAPFLSEARATHARQGQYRYGVAVFAERADVVLFLAFETSQFGIAVRGAAAELVEARQFPAASTAALTFLAPLEGA